MTPLVINSIAIVLTLLVLSRILGDNPLFRIAQYLFVGVSLGYAFVVVYFQVLRPGFFSLLANTADPVVLGLRVTPIILGVLLLPRLTNRQTSSWLANLPLGLLFGVGAALALGGALAGTLFPQMLASARPLGTEIGQIVGGVLLTIGVVCTLMYFYFTVPRDTGLGRFVASGGVIGRWLIIVAFGFFFAGALLTYLSALNERLQFVVSWVQSLL